MYKLRNASLLRHPVNSCVEIWDGNGARDKILQGSHDHCSYNYYTRIANCDQVYFFSKENFDQWSERKIIGAPPTALERNALSAGHDILTKILKLYIAVLFAYTKQQ